MSSATQEKTLYVRRFIGDNGGKVLEHLGEARLPTADWLVSSYGAVVRVSGPHDHLFERLVAILPRPQDATSEKFQPWANERFQQLDWYMEKANLGRVVQVVAHDMSMVGVIMRRLGKPPDSKELELGDATLFPSILERFVYDVERYVQNIGDEGLRYVRALKVYRVPRKKKDDDHVVGLDILPTVIGLSHDTSGIHPLTLVRGVIGEFAERADQLTKALGSKRAFFRGRGAVEQAEQVRDFLDQLCASIDLERPVLSEVRYKLKTGLGRPKKKSDMSMPGVIVTVALCALLAWYLAR